MKAKKKIAVVNVLFPPKALGGATRIVVDEASIILESYSDLFDVVVFTADVEKRPVYELNVYPYQGIRVYSVSAHINNWIHQDRMMGELFDQFLEFEKPDLVHFHCAQILTGSVVEAVQIRRIPHVITVHDAWWISDFQFLIDKSGKVYLDGHSDPFVMVTPPDGITFDQSINRRSYLKGLLSRSDCVLAVSDTYRIIYEKNGISNISTNKNGISDGINWQQKDTRHSDKVICAHIGGMSVYKGFEIFKTAFEEASYPNLEVLVVNHEKPKNYHAQVRWGASVVNIIGLVTQSEIAELYRGIDVLFAPSVCPESYGLVTREAAACGCWVVGSNVGAIGEDISPRNGFVVSPTAQALVQVLKDINQSPKKYKEAAPSMPVRYSSDQVSELVEIFKDVWSRHDHQDELASSPQHFLASA